jgi:hypothetical protein
MPTMGGAGAAAPLLPPFQTSKSQSSGTSFTGPSPYAVPLGKDLTRGYQSFVGGGGFAPGERLLQQTIEGKYLSPETGPLGDYRAAIGANFEDLLSRGLTMAKSKAGLKGVETGSAGQSIYADVAGRATNQASLDFQRAAMEQYARERAMMQGAPGALAGYKTQAFAPMGMLRESTAERSGEAGGYGWPPGFGQVPYGGGYTSKLPTAPFGYGPNPYQTYEQAGLPPFGA